MVLKRGLLLVLLFDVVKGRRKWKERWKKSSFYKLLGGLFHCFIVSLFTIHCLLFAVDSLIFQASSTPWPIFKASCVR